VRGLIKRWWFWLGICFFHVAIAAGYLLIPLNPPRISQANFDKIQLGWTSDQVTELLGYYSFSGGFRAQVDANWWGDDDNQIEIWFNEGLVTGKQFVPTKLSAFEQLKRRIEKRIREPRCPPGPGIGPPVRALGGIE
jgi:hypothetical protein